MRALILSDIHANLEALEAVLSVSEGQWDELWNLGDLVGYGASPNQVIDRLLPQQALVVRGNHDRVCCGLTSPNGFNPVARAAALWTRAELTEAHVIWLKEVLQGPLQPSCEGVTCAHGSPLDEDQYILNMRDAWAPLQQMLTPITFFGHTHIQCAFILEAKGRFQGILPAYPSSSGEQQIEVKLKAEARYLINPGSVGQPRDGDPRAAFLLYDAAEGAITFHRVPYKIADAQKKILTAGLPDRLAERLSEGR